MSGMPDIDARAAELVLYELSGLPRSHRHYAATPQSGYGLGDEAERVAVHERCAELYEELIAAAPGIWNGRDEARIAAAEAVIEGDGRG
ncbi:MAG TPA: hypothetical protein VFU74_22125 [Actinocrinis sp.]|nr:hypothetical protein [Actinocrinis sp.]